jgi:hypothetical protein
MRFQDFLFRRGSDGPNALFSLRFAKSSALSALFYRSGLESGGLWAGIGVPVAQTKGAKLEARSGSGRGRSIQTFQCLWYLFRKGRIMTILSFYGDLFESGLCLTLILNNQPCQSAADFFLPTPLAHSGLAPVIKKKLALIYIGMAIGFIVLSTAVSVLRGSSRLEQSQKKAENSRSTAVDY